MKKKILIPSAILLALTIGGVTMQPAKPIKQDTQSTNVATPAASLDAINGLPKDAPVDTPTPVPDPGTSETSTELPIPNNPSVDPIIDTPTPVIPMARTEDQPTQTSHLGPTDEQSNTAINDPTLNRIQITNP